MKLFPILRLTAISLLFFSLLNCGGGSSGGGGENSANPPNTNASLSSAPILNIEHSYDTFGQARGVLKDGDYIYVADGTTGLVVLQISQNGLTQIGLLQMVGNGHAYSIVKSGDYIFMAAREEGIYVIDVSDPSSPIFISTVATPDVASYLVLKQNLLFVSAGIYFLILDISDPINPQIIGQVQGSSPNQHLTIDNNIAYVAAYNKGLRIIDISNPSSPSIISEKSLGHNVRGIAKQGHYIYIGGGGSGLYVYEVSSPGNPLFIIKISLPDEDGQSLFDMAKWGNFLFIADGTSGIQTVDITNPTLPTLVKFVNISGSSQGVIVDNLTVVVAADTGGIHLLNIFETTDTDGDGFMDGEDAFPNNPLEWLDTDADGIGNNTDDDDDNDGFLDIHDAFPLNHLEWLDTDGDGVGNNSDVFPADPSEWIDTDGDGIGNNADDDDDNDGQLDINDPYPNDPFNTRRITNNGNGNREPKLDNNKIVWRGYYDNGKVGIFYKDISDPNGQTIDLADGIDGFIGYPSISNGQVAWRVWDKVDRFYIYFWDGVSTSSITDYPAGNFPMPFGYPPSYHSIEVNLNNGQISWAGWDGNDYEIFFWDGITISQITDNSLDDYEPQLNNGKISWTQTLSTGKFDIFFWDGNSIRNISNRPNDPDEDSHLMNGKIAWSGWNSSTFRRDIYIWDGTTTTVINLPGDDYEPQIDNSGSFVAWHNRTNNQFSIYIWDGSSITQIPPSSTFDDLSPFANEGKIAFSRYDSNGADIYIAEFR